ncbi:UNVERIFIED_CONTAM: hypothetical protein FKN15_033115 [Acipenser sinensis]
MTVETDSDSESDPGLTSSDSGSDFYPTKTPSDVTEEEDFPSFMEEPARNPESESEEQPARPRRPREYVPLYNWNSPNNVQLDIPGFIGTPGPKLDTAAFTSLQYFQLFLRYAARFLQQQRDSLGPHACAHKWKETRVPELKKPEKNGPKKDAGCAQRKAYIKTAATVA